jgi:hypothetical protein
MPAERDRGAPAEIAQGVWCNDSSNICLPDPTDPSITAAWDDLTRQASPNVFINPALLCNGADAAFVRWLVGDLSQR